MTTGATIVLVVIHAIFGALCFFLIPYPYNIFVSLGVVFTGGVSVAVNLAVAAYAQQNGEHAERCIEALLLDNEMLRKRNLELMYSPVENRPVMLVAAGNDHTKGE